MTTASGHLSEVIPHIIWHQRQVTSVRSYHTSYDTSVRSPLWCHTTPHITPALCHLSEVIPHIIWHQRQVTSVRSYHTSYNTSVRSPQWGHTTPHITPALGHLSEVTPHIILHQREVTFVRSHHTSYDTSLRSPLWGHTEYILHLHNMNRHHNSLFLIKFTIIWKMVLIVRIESSKMIYSVIIFNLKPCSK